MAAGAILGSVTRGTTNTNRLRRIDRWIASLPVLRHTADPLVVDLGFGASGVTSFELHQRLARVRADVEVLGIEIEPGRVRLANDQLQAVRAGSTSFDALARVGFARGGFEVPVAGGRLPAIIRALNVLRQYDESDVLPTWHQLARRLQPGGVAIDGTCDEIGRICSWVAVSPAGPESFTISLRLNDLERPSIVAERLPKVLIHRNVDDERIHALMGDLDAQWQYNAALASFGPTQRWIGCVQSLKDAGWPVLSRRTRVRLGELTLPWSAVAPRDFVWEGGATPPAPIRHATGA
jgi:hypothetical protein